MTKASARIPHWFVGAVALGALNLGPIVFGQDQLPPPEAPAPAAVASEGSRPSIPAATVRRQPAPDAEAPSIQGPPTGPLPQGGPAGGGAGGGAPDVEAPSLQGPSGGQREPQTDPNAPWWTRVPNVQPFPPPGNTIVPPTGPGYYTLLEWVLGDRHEAPPRYPYARFGIMMFSFYNADWRYLDNAGPEDRDPLDFLKRIRFLDDFMFTTGGEFRYRYNNENASRFSGKDNVFDQTRTRVYGDLWYRDYARIFAEVINAQSFNQDLPPVVTDQYNANFLNLFADAKVWKFKDQPVWFRVGRQELLYGSQRLISPLDWANTRRTFQGAKLFWQNEKWSLDAFMVQPVVPSANSFASVLYEQLFTGVWGTYRPIRGEVIDLYYLNLDDTRHLNSGRSGVLGAMNLSTVGSRWYGNKNNWLWDTEGMLQFGSFSNQGILAKAFTMGGGRVFPKVPFNPSLWVYYDYASGDPNPGSDSVHRTFNQLFPFGHYYFGMTDLIGRQNINDVNAEIAFFPTKCWTTWVQYHVLRLDSPKDALYNSAGVPTRQDITGRAGSDVGEVLTVINNFTIDVHQNVFVQYSHLYAGDFIRQTGKPGSPDFLYFMYSFRW
jgi:hypothetical protein